MRIRIVGIGSLLALSALVIGFLVLPSIAGPANNLVANGDFEGGFGVDGVAYDWHKFDNGGAMTASWHDDTWAPVVYEGAHSQLVEINTFCCGASDPNRVAGIYQTLSVNAGTTYELCLHGMLRSLRGDPDPQSWGYTANVGIDHNGGTDWSALSGDDWTDIPWDTVYPRIAPAGEMDSFCMNVKAESNSLTLFIRLWKKWPTGYREVLLNADDITFKG
ncbi:MAG: hypothetical protein CEE40_03990 [Chloroflexi bacterium B3_Chlor]|nr:MAG: hypothetical protein CEE40_03990 [Chloroflexi bacterium B3_Chlor]